MPCGFQKRAVYYNFLSLLLATAFTLLANFTNSIGLSICGTCYIKLDTIGEHLIWLYWIYSPFIIISVFIPQQKPYKITQRMLLAFWILYLPFALNRVWAIYHKKLEWLTNLEAISLSSLVLILYGFALISYETKDPLSERLIIDENIKTEENLKRIEIEPIRIRQTCAAVYYVIKNTPEFITIPLDFNHFSMFKNKQTWTIYPKDINLEKFSNLDLLSFPWTITAYMLEIFANICIKDNISKAEIIESMISIFCDHDLISNQQKYSHRFIFKIVTSPQLEFILSSMPSIYNHTVISSRNKSLLNRIVAIYNIKDKHQSFNIVMIENIIFSGMKCILFELSGSKLVRTASDNGNISKNDRIVLNDVDFLQTQNYLPLSFAERYLLQRIVRDDLELLKSIGAVQYSFFLAVVQNFCKTGITSRYTRHYFDGKDEKLYSISIINTFTSNNLIDTNKIKKIGGVKEYADRFWNLLSNMIKCDSI